MGKLAWHVTAHFQNFDEIVFLCPWCAAYLSPALQATLGVRSVSVQGQHVLC